jgi:hypothetical protein
LPTQGFKDFARINKSRSRLRPARERYLKIRRRIFFGPRRYLPERSGIFYPDTGSRDSTAVQGLNGFGIFWELRGLNNPELETSQGLPAAWHANRPSHAAAWPRPAHSIPFSRMNGSPRPALAGLEVGEHEGALAALGLGVVGHHLERGADQRGEVDLVDDQQVRLGDAGAALAGIFSPAATSIT